MKTIKEMYQELNRAVIDKLVSKDYEFLSYGRFTARLKVDDLPITLWIGSGADYLSTYGDFGESNFIDLAFTDEEKKILWNIFRIPEEEKKQQRIKELENEIKALKV